MTMPKKTEPTIFQKYLDASAEFQKAALNGTNEEYKAAKEKLKEAVAALEKDHEKEV